ncbi:hypothetical protein WA538_001517, partial [Blastocystis sp. DL]
NSNTPFVVQCANCHLLITDSLCGVRINEDLNLFVVDRAQNLTSENQLKLAIGQKDEGSSYFELTCSGCHNTIGRYYKSTTDYSDAYRDKFALYMDKVTTYSLGSCSQSSRDDSATPSYPNAILLSFDAERARNDALALKEIKSIILHLNQRLSAIESSHS